MTRALAILIGIATYSALAWVMGVMVARIMGPLPDQVVKLLKLGWGEIVKTYWTVRYEEDDDGLWQIIEDAEGGRYRVHIRERDGEMKW